MPDGWTVTFYEHVDFTGQELELTEATAKVFGGFNDKASSIAFTKTNDDIVVDSRVTDSEWLFFED
ncbi:hypothetical protein [Amycolatopsis magusensis]|uniref:Uncharacterized protein n=1 Tax=Amycolatopsis magusensis TaxID=882444 RepID=A0ABS4PY81_9PSEU|nr:hypothetical protein [Amycolatopsis magusensis]MBP2183789.1 hypothetical protein [Amycolatopsis magusensis]